MGRTGQHDDHGEEEDGAEKKRIDLNLSQIVGAGVATLTAATAASYLNVYGTIIGAAVMAILSTIVSPLIQHWFSRSGEQARHLAGKATRHPRVSVTPAEGADIDTDALSEAGRAGTLPGAGGAGAFPGFSEGTDAARTMAMPVVGGPDGRTVVDGYANPGDPATVDGYGDSGVVGGLGDPTVPTQASGATTRMPAVGGYAGEPVGSGSVGKKTGPTRLGRRAVVISAVVVFVLAMMVILLFELLTGRSLTAWTQGGEEPTTPTLFGGSTSVSQSQEDGTDTPAVPEDAPDTSGQQQENGIPDTVEPTGPETGTEAPEDDGAGSGEGTDGTGDTTPGDTGAPGDTGDTTTPTDPPAEGEDSQDPGVPEPDPGTGGQGGQDGGNTVPEPAPVD